LRILGNGVVPQQAALAYTILNERLQPTPRHTTSSEELT
jgi:hypothetical protein